MDGVHVVETSPGSVVKGCFLFLHGMESHSEWFEPLFPKLLQSGFAVMAYDRPGWGRSTGVRGHIESYREVLELLSRFATIARERYGSVHLAGMSWGGMLSLYASLRRPWLFDSLTLIAPGLAARTDLSFFSKIRTAGRVLGGKLDAPVPTAFKPEHFTGNPGRQEFIRSDRYRVDKVTAGFCFETLKMRRFIGQTVDKRALPPSQCLLAAEDAIIDNPRVAGLCRSAGAAVHSFSGCRHTLVFEEPESVSSALLHQAAQAESAASTASGPVWIAGAGAIGGVTGALLSFGGVRTGILVKEKYKASYREQGITLEAGEGKRTTGENVCFGSSPAELPSYPALLIIAVKSFDTDAVLSELSGKLPKETVIASLQNGLGNEPKVAKAFPANPVIAASICASVEMPAPGRVRWPDDRGGVSGARYSGAAALAEGVWKECLPLTGMECGWVSGERAAARLKWSKLMLNTGFNALNSLTGMTSSQIMADSVYGELVVRALREGFKCMNLLGLRPVDLPGYPVSKLGKLVSAPMSVARRAMAWQAGRSTEAAFSMRQDVLKNRQHTEISELNGIIVKTGHNLHFPTPVNTWLESQVNNRH